MTSHKVPRSVILAAMSCCVLDRAVAAAEQWQEDVLHSPNASRLAFVARASSIDDA